MAIVVVVVEVTISVALRFSHHLYGTRNARTGDRIWQKNLRATYIHASNIGWVVKAGVGSAKSHLMKLKWSVIT